MKTIKIANGEIRKGYELNDLSNEVFDKVLRNQVDFEIMIMDENSPYYYLVEEHERMGTPWFLGESIYHDHRASLIENMRLNGYLFDEEGEILPLTYHHKGAKIVRTTYGKNELECTIE